MLLIVADASAQCWLRLSSLPANIMRIYSPSSSSSLPIKIFRGECPEVLHLLRAFRWSARHWPLLPGLNNWDSFLPSWKCPSLDSDTSTAKHENQCLSRPLRENMTSKELLMLRTVCGKCSDTTGCCRCWGKWEQSKPLHWSRWFQGSFGCLQKAINWPKSSTLIFLSTYWKLSVITVPPCIFLVVKWEVAKYCYFIITSNIFHINSKMQIHTNVNVSSVTFQN